MSLILPYTFSVTSFALAGAAVSTSFNMADLGLSSLTVRRYVCSICHSFAGSSYYSVVRHMRCHQHEPYLVIICGLEGCRDSFKNYSTFRRHIYRKHKLSSVSSAASEKEDEPSIPDQSNMELQYQDCPQDQLLSIEDIYSERQSAMFLLKMMAERRTSQSALNGVVADMREFWEESLEKLKVYTN